MLGGVILSVSEVFSREELLQEPELPFESRPMEGENCLFVCLMFLTFRLCWLLDFVWRVNKFVSSIYIYVCMYH